MLSSLNLTFILSVSGGKLKQIEPSTVVSPGENWEVACSEATVW